MYLHWMQIKSKSNLKFALITFSVLNFEASSSGKCMWGENQEEFWSSACIKYLFFIFIAIISPKHKLKRDLFIVFHSERSDIWCPSVVSDTSSSSGFFYGLTTRICSVSASVLTHRFLIFLLGVQNLYKRTVVVQHREMSTD